MKAVSFVLARLREPSTWSALAVVAAVAGRPFPAGVTEAAPELAGLALAILGAVLPEKKGA